MPVNTDIKTLSQTPSQNGPAGTDPPSTLDDAIRYALSFIAQHRDGLGFAIDAIVKALGYTPVQQGTGPGQSTSVIKIGWTANDGLRLAIDATNFGSRWPISIEGVAETAKYATKAGFADTATSATNAAYASSAGSANSANYAASAGTAESANFAGNANGLGGRGPAGWVQNLTPGNGLTWAWDGYAMVGRVDGSVQYAWTEWSRVVNRPDRVSQFTNDMRYVVAQGQYGQVAVASPDGAQFAGFALPVQENRIGRIGVIQGGLFVTADGNNFSWPINPSDERLKTNIRPTQEDSLAKLRAIDFKAFDFTDEVPMFAGISRKAGVIAQQLEQIDPDWVTHEVDYRQLNIETMLTSAMHAIQQLSAEVQALRAQVSKS